MDGNTAEFLRTDRTLCFFTCRDDALEAKFAMRAVSGLRAHEVTLPSPSLKPAVSPLDGQAGSQHAGKAFLDFGDRVSPLEVWQHW